nr:MAG TPA_asm: hypothetical protein [Caudoviricetes sp.]
MCDLNVMKITKPPTEVYRTFHTRLLHVFIRI